MLEYKKINFQHKSPQTWKEKRCPKTLKENWSSKVRSFLLFSVHRDEQNICWTIWLWTLWSWEPHRFYGVHFYKSKHNSCVWNSFIFKRERIWLFRVNGKTIYFEETKVRESQIQGEGQSKSQFQSKNEIGLIKQNNKTRFLKGSFKQ